MEIEESQKLSRLHEGGALPIPFFSIFLGSCITISGVATCSFPDVICCETHSTTVLSPPPFGQSQSDRDIFRLRLAPAQVVAQISVANIILSSPPINPPRLSLLEKKWDPPGRCVVEGGDRGDREISRGEINVKTGRALGRSGH